MSSCAFVGFVLRQKVTSKHQHNLNMEAWSGNVKWELLHFMLTEYFLLAATPIFYFGRDIKTAAEKGTHKRIKQELPNVHLSGQRITYSRLALIDVVAVVVLAAARW